ncbi:MAG: radical SAM protein [Desulfobulbus sp.]|nr:radical SAM protein [Desulfobulbus sp.]
MKKKVLFIQPTIYDDRGHLIKKRKLYFVGLAYPLLAALTPQDWECEICLETIEDIPFNSDASLIACGGMGHAANRSREIAAEFKRQGKAVIAGGPMFSLAPEISGSLFDSVLIGDAEEVWAKLICDFENINLKRFYEKKLVSLSTPLPRYDLILPKRIGDFLPVQAGRGCPHRCKFCSIACMYRGAYLKRDIAEVMRDIRHVKSLGFNRFLLLDDNIAADPGYLKKLCREIAGLGMEWMSQCALDIADNQELLELMAQSGCSTLSFGLESVSQSNLEEIGKGWCHPAKYLEQLAKVRESGIEIASEMMVGLDGDTPETLADTVEFTEQSCIITPKFYIMTPIPGTDFYNEMRAAGRLTEEDVCKYTPTRAVIRHPTMTMEEITAMFWEIYNQVYSLRRIVQRCLLHRRFLRRPARYVFYLMVNLYYRYQIKRKIGPIIM